MRSYTLGCSWSTEKASFADKQLRSLAISTKLVMPSMEEGGERKGVEEWVTEIERKHREPNNQ